jgi:hypothetical protein
MGFWSSLFGNGDDDGADLAEVDRVLQGTRALRSAASGEMTMEDWAQAHDSADALLRRMGRATGRSAEAESIIAASNARRRACR